jgi:cephalosporin hydroxylase
MDFESRNQDFIQKLGNNKELRDLSREWIRKTADYEYGYHFRWMGRPIIQLPQDILAMQEIIWQVKPDLIIETGIAHGGSLILSASLLAMIDYREAVEADTTLDPKASRRRVLGLDIDIRAHNRTAIETHPLAHKIDMIQGSSIAPDIIAQVYESSHTQEHVLAELEAYAPLVSPDSYCVVFDTIIEDTSDDVSPDRPWGKGNNPKTAVWEFLKTNDRFTIDKEIENKLLITVAPDGYLRCIKD